MQMSTLWTDLEVEKLRKSLLANKLWSVSENITSSSPIIQKIIESAELERDGSAVLNKIREMGLVKEIGKVRSFIDHETKVSVVGDRKVHICAMPPYRKLHKKGVSDISKIMTEIKNCSTVAEALDIAIKASPSSSVNSIKRYLKELGVFSFDGEFKMNLPENNPSEMKYFIDSKKLSDKEKSLINANRGKSSVLFNPYQYKKPTIVYGNDGTGFGKSFGVTEQFIAKKTILDFIDSEFDDLYQTTSMFFISPLKSQLRIDESQQVKARDNGIELLEYLSEADISNIEFKSWLSGKTNLDKYTDWYKKYPYANDGIKDVRRNIGKINGLVNNLKFNKKLLKNRSTDDFDEKELKDAIKEQEINLFTSIRKASLAIIHNKETEHLICNEDNSIARDIEIEILKTYVPLEFAKFKKCLFLSTTAKFNFTARLVSEPGTESGDTDNRTGQKIDSKPFWNILGSKKVNKEALAGMNEQISKPFHEQISYLKSECMQDDESSYFSKNNIRFNIVIDEEHDSYATLYEHGSSKLIDENCRVEDIFSNIHSIFMNHIGVLKDPGYINKFASDNENGNKFVMTGYKLFNEHCEAHDKGFEFIDILKMFSNNREGVVIDTNEVENIENISKNVFNFSTKRFFHNDSLKKIKVCSLNGNTVTEISSKGTSKNSLTLFDLYQALLVIIKLCSEVDKESAFFKQNSHRSEHNKYYALYNFINRCHRIKDHISNIFNSNNDDFTVNDFYTYFCHKTIFSIKKRKDFNYMPTHTGIMVIDFSVEVRSELPEVSIMNALYNTNNVAQFLSATSGIHGNYTDCFNRKMIDTYSREFGIECKVRDFISRSPESTHALKEIRDLRGMHRDVSFLEFNQDKEIFSEHFKGDKQYKNAYMIYKKNFGLKGNQYKKRESGRIIDGILSAAIDKKNTLMLALSNDFMSEFRRKCKEDNLMGIKKVEGSNDYVYDIKPFKNRGCELRVVLYSSQTDKDINVRQFLNFERTDKKVVFISSYRSAGTGLNYFVNYIDGHGTELEEDFERLILINNPLYSKTKGKGSMNTIDNYVTLLKYHSDSSNPDINIKQFSTNLVDGENFNILLKEHNWSLFKVMLQAIGRVERKDTKITSEIIIPEEILEHSAIMFSELNSIFENKPMIESMSLLNTKFMERCMNYMKTRSFENESDRIAFEEQTEDSEAAIDEFMEQILLPSINEVRAGNLEQASLNEIIRHENTIFNPQKTIKALKAHPLIAGSGFESEIDKFWINKRGLPCQDIMLFRKKGSFFNLSDNSGGGQYYDPYKQIIPQYNTELFKDNDKRPIGIMDSKDIVTLMMKKYTDIYSNQSFDINMVPHPALLPLLKGNIGEIIFKDLLNNYFHIDEMSIEDVAEKITPIAYELFDFYIESDSGSTLVCIDVKNHALESSKDKGFYSEMFEKTENKIRQISEHAGGRYKEIKFIYLNTKFDENEIHNKPEFSDSDVSYFNLFKRTPHYAENKNRFNDDKKPKSKATIATPVRINNNLYEVLNINVF